MRVNIARGRNDDGNDIENVEYVAIDMKTNDVRISVLGVADYIVAPQGSLVMVNED